VWLGRGREKAVCGSKHRLWWQSVIEGSASLELPVNGARLASVQWQSKQTGEGGMPGDAEEGD